MVHAHTHHPALIHANIAQDIIDRMLTVHTHVTHACTISHYTQIGHMPMYAHIHRCAQVPHACNRLPMQQQQANDCGSVKDTHVLWKRVPSAGR